MDMNLKNYHENNGSSKKPSKLRVRLQDIMDAMEMQFDEVSSYLNIKTGKTVTVSDEELRAMEEDEYEENFGPEGMEQVRAVSEGHGDYISLPDRFEINEYDVIREFALDNPDKKIAEILLVSIQGSGAFRRFKDMLYIHGIEQEWYGYRNREYEKIAIKWCERHGIEYER
jgi:hypothetical protein